MSMPESRSQPGAQKALPANDTPPEAGVIFVHDPQLSQFDFGPDHPLRPRRHELLMDLLAKTGLLPPDDPAILIQKQASREELLLVHTAQYIDAVEHLSAG